MTEGQQQQRGPSGTQRRHIPRRDTVKRLWRAASRAGGWESMKQWAREAPAPIVTEWLQGKGGAA